MLSLSIRAGTVVRRSRTIKQLHVLTMVGKRHSFSRTKFRAIWLVHQHYLVLIYVTHASLASRINRLVKGKIIGQSQLPALLRNFTAGLSGFVTPPISMSSIKTITNTRQGILIRAIDTFGRVRLYRFVVTRSKGGWNNGTK